MPTKNRRTHHHNHVCLQQHLPPPLPLALKHCLGRFAISRAKGELSAKDAASVEAQDSAVDGGQPDSSNPTSETVAQNRGEADANANDSSAGSGGTTATAKGGDDKEEEGLLSGIAGSVSGWFSEKK